MKKDHGLVLRLFLILGDIIAIILAFASAYFIRTHLSGRPYFFTPNLTEFVFSALFFIPLWVVILALLGLYQRNVFYSFSKSVGRLFIASIIGVMGVITLDFFLDSNLFPVRPVAIYSMIFCFIFLCLARVIIKFIYRQITKHNHATSRVVIIGNHKNTEYLSSYIASHPETGYKVSGIVSGKRFIPKDLHTHQYSSLKEALNKAHPDIVFQTDENKTEYVYKQTILRHIAYYFVPSESALSSHMGDLEFIGSTPAILVKVTPLSGWAKVVKRASDIVFGGIATILALIPMAIVWLIIKISDPRHPAIYASYRLSRYNKEFKMYKFRSMKYEYSGMTPEEAFIKMGKPELIKKYRKNGDFLEKDPRITKFGKFIRSTSLDELLQLFNILKGDISLVGPRALLPGELRDYGDRSLLLTVKSGLTGLAQVSGRRDISFEERRSLDLYYIQNWSLWMDIQIIFRTFGIVFRRKGAK